MLDFNSNVSIYIQIANLIENAIFEEVFLEEQKIPSTNDFAKQYSINPHTVLKGMNLLVEKELIYKKRGLGMFVKKGALDKIIINKRNDFFENNLDKFLIDARKLKISKQELFNIIDKSYKI